MLGLFSRTIRVAPEGTVALAAIRTIKVAPEGTELFLETDNEENGPRPQTRGKAWWEMPELRIPYKGCFRLLRA